MWEGYVEYDGTEIINVTRTETYARHFPGFLPLFDNDALPYLLEDRDRYTTPLQDDAPWTDPDVPESYDFYGVYPLGMDGAESSSRTASPVESLGEGGVTGRIRHGMKSITFSVALLGASDAAVAYGFMWLKQALLGGACGPGFSSGCGGGTLCFLKAEPVADKPTPREFVAAELSGGNAYTETELVVDGGDLDSVPEMELTGGDAWTEVGYVLHPNQLFSFTVDPRPNPAVCLEDYLRSLHKVSVPSGPTVTAKRQIRRTGHNVWTATFTAVAGDPYELGAEVPVIAGFLDPGVEVPWAGGEIPDGGALDPTGYIHADTDCSKPVFRPVVDPLCPAVIPPPGPPSVPIGCFTPPVNWRRRQFTIPRQYVPLWGEVVPRLSIHARGLEMRDLRLRFYPDPFNTGTALDDPCNFCGDIVVSYVPADSTLIFDGSTQTIDVVNPGGERQRADSLVFGSDGRPFEWPVLSCGTGYIVTLDLPEQQAPPVVDLSLFPRVA